MPRRQSSVSNQIKDRARAEVIASAAANHTGPLGVAVETSSAGAAALVRPAVAAEDVRAALGLDGGQEEFLSGSSRALSRSRRAPMEPRGARPTRARQARPVASDLGDQGLPDGGARWPRRALRGMYAHRYCGGGARRPSRRTRPALPSLINTLRGSAIPGELLGSEALSGDGGSRSFPLGSEQREAR